MNHLVHGPGAAGQGFDYLLLPGLPMVDVPLYALGSVVDQLPVAGTDQVWALPGQQLQEAMYCFRLRMLDEELPRMVSPVNRVRWSLMK